MSGIPNFLKQLIYMASVEKIMIVLEGTPATLAGEAALAAAALICLRLGVPKEEFAEIAGKIYQSTAEKAGIPLQNAPAAKDGTFN